MIRLRHLVKTAPSSKEIKNLTLNDDVTFTPMDNLKDGVGGIDASKKSTLGELLQASYNYFAEGDLLLAKVTPCFENGKKAIAKGLINGIGFATSEVYVIRPNLNKINPNYLRYVFCAEDFRAEALKSMTGSGGLRRVSENAILNYCPRIVDIQSQREIADFLDCETDRIDQILEKKKTFLLKASKRIESLVDKAISCQLVPRLRFENVVQRMQRTVNLSEYDELIRLGLYNWGRGIFKKPAADEEGMGDSKFFFVEDGDLILSGQFAWEGAVALATSKEEGCVVSHRYPIYRGKGSVNTAYLFGLFRSNFGDFILNEASRGSAGRNRPLNTWRLGKEKIPIPEISLQEEIEQAVIFERCLREQTQRSVDILEEFRSSLITEAVTGQLDIQLWKKRGKVDKRLDNIEEAMRT